MIIMKLKRGPNSIYFKSGLFSPQYERWTFPAVVV